MILYLKYGKFLRTTFFTLLVTYSSEERGNNPGSTWEIGAGCSRGGETQSSRLLQFFSPTSLDLGLMSTAHRSPLEAEPCEVGVLCILYQFSVSVALFKKQFVSIHTAIINSAKITTQYTT